MFHLFSLFVFMRAIISQFAERCFVFQIISLTDGALVYAFAEAFACPSVSCIPPSVLLCSRRGRPQRLSATASSSRLTRINTRCISALQARSSLTVTPLQVIELLELIGLERSIYSRPFDTLR